MIGIGLAVAMLALQEPAEVLTVQQDSPAMTAALANKPLMKVAPKFKSGPEDVFPEAARAAGEHGSVKISGILGVDGRLSELKVALTSRSALLDQSAMTTAAATVFEPARDAKGTPISVPISVPYAFDNSRTPGRGGGVLRYKCDQFARDMDWWYRTWPESKKDTFYTLVLGVSLLSQGGLKVGLNREFESRWKAAIEACKTKPDRLFIDVFQPEGEVMRRLANQN